MVAVGSAVTSLRIGDNVYSRVPDSHRGTVAEYCLSTSTTTAIMPNSLSFTDAAAIPLTAMTALQCMQRAQERLPGGLEGKTIFIPGGLSGTGSFAVQLAKNVFGAQRVVTTLSATKMVKAKEMWGEDGVVEYIDYTKGNVATSVGQGTVDYMFDTMGQATQLVPVMKKGGVIVSISMLPPGSVMKKRLPSLPAPMKYFLDFMNCYYTWKSSRWGVHYTYLLLDESAKDLDMISNWVVEGKLRPIVGSTANLYDLDEVIKGCQQVYDGRGGVGKFVINII